MDRLCRPGIFCLLPLLFGGCNDPGFELRRAAYEGKVAAAEKILQAHPELINTREKPIPVIAVAPGAPRGSTEWVHKLFAPTGKDFFDYNRSGMTPLHLAARTEKEDMIKLLLRHHADPNATNLWGYTPLSVAVWCKAKPAIANLLLDAKADLNLKSVHQYTPLELAAIYGNTNYAELFLKRGALVNATNISGMTPLHRAALGGQYPMVQLLLSYQANLNDLDVQGNTPLNWAAVQGHFSIIMLLLESGADVNIVNNEGMSPLFRVVQTNPRQMPAVLRLQLVDLLLAKKAEVNLTNRFSATLFQAALRDGDTTVISRLRQHGARE